MPRGMLGKGNRIDSQDLTILKTFDVGVTTESGLKQPFSLLCAQIGMTAHSGMIRMGMGDNGPIHRLPGIDIKIALGAVKTAGR